MDIKLEITEKNRTTFRVKMLFQNEITLDCYMTKAELSQFGCLLKREADYVREVVTAREEEGTWTTEL